MVTTIRSREAPDLTLHLEKGLLVESGELA